MRFEVRHRSDQRGRELAADDGAQLRDLLDPAEAVEAREQAVVQRGRNGQRRHRSDERVCLVAFLQAAAFQHRAREFFDEQRDAVALAQDLPRDVRRQRLARHLRHHARPFVGRERPDDANVEIDPFPGRQETGPGQDQHHRLPGRQALGEDFQQLERRRVGPMDVFDQ